MAKTSILNIGDELLIGQVVNTNASEMAKMLNKAGFDVFKTTVCADNAESIRTNLRNMMSEYDIVLITGGLGPTKDDITKKILAEEFDSVLIENTEVLAHVEQFFKNRQLPFTSTNREQALVPSKCKVIFNEVGTAPGMCFEKDGKIIISMPGVPFEMRFMMPKVIEILKQNFETETIEHRTLLFSGIGESFLSDMLEEYEANLPSNISLAYLPKGGTVRLRLSVRGKNANAVIALADEYSTKLKSLTEKYFMGFDSDNLAETLGKQLIEHKASVTTAESCTGGNIAHLITLVPGSSSYYKGSIVSYANEVKENVLHVRKEDIQNYGAVSEEVVRQMAKGAREVLNTDYAIATSGIAGPDGGNDEKPVGTVWIAVADKQNCIAEKFLFKTTRENFIERTSNQALLMCLQLLSQNSCE